MTKQYFHAVLAAFFLSLVLCLVLIPVLRKLKAGQNILSYVKEHKGKSGTPAMGGLAFIPAASIVSLFFIDGDRSAIVALAVGLAYLSVGFLDDLLKKKRKENLGLRAWQKIVFQTLVAIFAGVYGIRTGADALYIPFLKRTIKLGGFMLPFCVFVFLSLVNCVNLTDGLDGLAAGVSLPFFLALAVIVTIEGRDRALVYVSLSLVGALAAYLFFNASPASVFMGDTGSLSLGGFASSIAVFSGNTLYIPILGIMFVLSGITVIIQVIYYKATGGKRVFLMAPVHHHFQEKGYSESKISYAYSAVTALMGIVCVLGAL